MNKKEPFCLYNWKIIHIPVNQILSYSSFILWYLNQSLDQTDNMNLGMQAQFLLFLFKELSNIVLIMEFRNDLTLQTPIVL
jgi:hypothetical protein